MRLHLIDGTYELYRAHFSPRPGHADPQGVDCKATFDNPIRSFRNDLFEPYKSDEGVPPELRAQFDRVEAAVRAIGVAVWSMREHEADDGLAAGARRFRDEVDQVRIMTPDKDLGQCVVGTRVVQVDRRQNKVTDEATFRATRGYGPVSVPDFLALTGDTADGIPGLPGFGEKSAAALVGAYVHLEDIPDDSRTWKVPVRGAARLAETLKARRADAIFYRKLATLVDTIPVAESLEALRFRGVPRGRFERWCADLGARHLTAMPKRWDPA